MSILIAIDDGFPILFSQKRVGLNDKFFLIYKFRSMYKNVNKYGTSPSKINDNRITKIGTFIRKTSIDEIPQFLNVLKGDMSIVGPRPQMQVDFDKFPVDKKNEIYKSQPGITGIGSIIFRDEEKWISNFGGDKHKFYKEKIAPYKAEVEIWYYHNQSIFIDFKLIFLTAWVIFFPNSNIVEDVLKSLPKKPSHLES